MIKRTLLLIADGFYPGERLPEYRINTYLALALGQRGWNVEVWTGLGAQLPPFSDNVRIIRTAKLWNFVEVFRIIFWLILKKPKKVIIMYHRSLYSSRPDINWIPIIAKCFGVRCITLFTNNRKPKRNALQDRIISAIGYNDFIKYPIGPFSASTKLIFYCSSDQNILLGLDPLNLRMRSEITPPPHVLAAASPFDRASYRASMGVADDGFLIGYFGLIYRGKGIEWLLDALSIVKSRGVRVKTVIMGPNAGVTAEDWFNFDCLAYEKSLKSKAEHLGIQNATIWKGFCRDQEVITCLSSCDIICLPFDDGLTNHRSSFIACARIGLPVITTLTSETDEFLRDPRSGILFVQPRSAGEIAKNILLLYEDAELRESRALMLKQFAARNYINDRFVDCFDDTS